MNKNNARQSLRIAPINHNVEVWSLVLNRYQRDNLLYLLNCVGYPGDNPHRKNGDRPVNLFNTGDWLGEIAIMLSKDSYPVEDNPGIVCSCIIDDCDNPNIRF